jgi:conjugal transfer pilus assembly protein TraA
MIPGEEVKKMNKRMVFVLFFGGVMFFALPVFAGTGGAEFQEIYSTLTDWTQGYLGKAIAAGLFLTGMAIGIVRQSLMSIVMGIAGGMAVNYTPSIIDSVVTALI